MTNERIAAVLAEIADLLELTAADSFKIRSYRRAAATVEFLGESLEEVFADQGAEGLQQFPGIGTSIAEKIAELITTGKSHYHEELRSKYPPQMLEMFKVPGFGPRKAAHVYQELGIGSVDDLEEAARAHKLQTLSGMGPKSEEKLLRAIEIYRQGIERNLLGNVLPVANKLIEELRAMPEVIEAEMAGSTRRGRDTIGDLDLLATAERPAEVCRRFAGSKLLAEVTLAGDTKVSGLLESGRQVDLRVVEPASYGAALVYFTGSKQHNIHLRGMALDRGLTINEYGVYELRDGERGKLVAGRTEEDVYAAVGLAWIAPELREDRGEIEAALAGTLPSLIAIDDIKCDLHMHTLGSDGQNTVEEMAAEGVARGYTHLGITDHSPHLQFAGGQKADEILQQIAQIAAYNAEHKGHKFTVLAGIEADILSDGGVDAPEECWPKLDFVIGSIHAGFTQDADTMTGRIVTAIRSGRMDILGHPTGRLLLERAPYAHHIEQIIEAAVENHVALEINADPNRLDLNDINSRMGKEAGAMISINTDAHSTRGLGNMQYGIITARRGWIEPRIVINTWLLSKLRKWLAKRRQSDA